MIKAKTRRQAKPINLATKSSRELLVAAQYLKKKGDNFTRQAKNYEAKDPTKGNQQKAKGLHKKADACYQGAKQLTIELNRRKGIAEEQLEGEEGEE